MAGQITVFIRGDLHFLWIEKGEMPLIEIEHQRFVRCRMSHRKQL